MAKFTKAIDIHTADVSTLQPGQWVYAGPHDGQASPTMGRFMGTKRSGSVVVAWLGNARAYRNTKAGIAGYFASLRNYAQAY